MTTEEDERLTIVAEICEALPREELNRDVARGVAFAVGYISMVGGPQQKENQ